MASPHVGRLRVTRQRIGICAVGAAMLLAAVLGLAGLSNHPFWDDEANTAIYGRNLLKFGRLTAWDGTNLVGYALGGALGEDLGKELRVPALPAYVAALGMLLFGETNFGGRVTFVVAGIVSVGLLAIWMRRLLGRRFPWYLPSLILAVSPAYLLYVRNCRYYALGVTFTLLLWIVWRIFSTSWSRPKNSSESSTGAPAMYGLKRLLSSCRRRRARVTHTPVMTPIGIAAATPMNHGER